ncbi:hypothetical protein [Actinospongicola halichondriae]|uniref:hypothetical protein n=1 Tax=Actinospongicola halichondriae TaxID=3236844 RepID=UPI003D528877
MTAVFFAISVTGILAVASLVLGASTGYTSVRNGQNAADAAALAATSTLRDVGQGNALPAEVLAVAVSVAEDNGADGGSVVCDVVNRFYAVTRAESDVIGPCDGTNETSVNASGVRVQLADTSDVPFGGVIDQEEITADAVAAATVQPLRGGFSAPFMLCADAPDHGVDLLVPDATLDPPYRVNTDAFNVEFLLWSNGNGFGDRNCGVSPWHGLVNSDNVYQIPSDPDDDDGWWDVDTGSRVGHIERLLAGDDSCDWATDADIDAAAGCRLALPLCVETVGSGTNVRLNCVRLAVFEITYVGDGDDEGSCVSVNKKVVCGRLIPGGVATGGQGTLEVADPSELVAIKLVQ